AVTVPGVDEPERVGAVDQPAVGEHPVEQGTVHVPRHRWPAADRGEVGGTQTQRAPGHDVGVGLGRHPAADGEVVGDQVDEVGALADHGGAGVVVGQHQVPHVLRTVPVVIVHLGQQVAAGGGGGGGQRLAQVAVGRNVHDLQRPVAGGLPQPRR